MKSRTLATVELVKYTGETISANIEALKDIPVSSLVEMVNNMGLQLHCRKFRILYKNLVGRWRYVG